VTEEKKEIPLYEETQSEVVEVESRKRTVNKAIVKRGDTVKIGIRFGGRRKTEEKTEEKNEGNEGESEEFGRVYVIDGFVLGVEDRVAWIISKQLSILL